MMPTLKKGTLSGVVKHLAQGNNLHFHSFVVSGSIMMLTQLYSPLLFVRRKNKVFCDGYYLHLLSSFTLFFTKVSILFHRTLILNKVTMRWAAVEVEGIVFLLFTTVKLRIYILHMQQGLVLT